MIQRQVFLGLKIFDEVLPKAGKLKRLNTQPTLIGLEDRLETHCYSGETEERRAEKATSQHRWGHAAAVKGAGYPLCFLLRSRRPAHRTSVFARATWALVCKKKLCCMVF